MSRGPKSSFEDIFGTLFAWALITTIVSDVAHITFLLALAIVAAIAICGTVLIFGITTAWKYLEAAKPCKHGVWAASNKRCQLCQTELDRVNQQNEEREFEWKRRKTIEREAKELRQQEIERLSKAWLTNTESYFQMNPQQFEHAVAELFRKLGYTVKQTPFSNDGGKDAIAHKDGKTYIIECKRYDASNSIGRRDIQIFVAAMKDEKASGGFYINTGNFTRTAKEYAAKNGITIYDRFRLPHLVNEAYPLTVDIATVSAMCLECGSITSMPVSDMPITRACLNGHLLTSNITRADLRIISSTGIPFCDRCGTPMRIVNNYRGKFWGCPRYPRCKCTKRFQSMNSEKYRRSNEET